MEIKSIMCCCGAGIGSSFIVSMNVEQALKEMGITGVRVEHDSISDAKFIKTDLFVLGKDLEYFAKDLDRVILLDDLMDIDEIKTKLKEYFK